MANKRARLNFFCCCISDRCSTCSPACYLINDRASAAQLIGVFSYNVLASSTSMPYTTSRGLDEPQSAAERLLEVD